MIMGGFKRIINWKSKMGLAIILGLVVGLVFSMYLKIIYESESEYNTVVKEMTENKQEFAKLSKEIEANNSLVEQYKLSPEFLKGSK